MDCSDLASYHRISPLFLPRYGVSADVTNVLSSPDCEVAAFIGRGRFGLRLPSIFVITVGKANPCSTPQIANTTRHSIAVGLARFSGHSSFALMRVMMIHEHATIYKEMPNPCAPNKRAEAVIARNQIKSIEAQASDA
jgi:hypothetical protein